MDKPRKLISWLACLAASLLAMPATPAAAFAEVGTLTVQVPSAPIAFNASFSMTINFANNGTTAIADPDAVLYIQAKNASGTVLPLLPANVTIHAPTIPVYLWNTGSGTQVGIKFFPDVHADLAPGWNSNYIFTVAIAMPAGTASLPMGVRVWKSSNSSDVYRSWSGQVSVTSPLPPLPSPIAATVIAPPPSLPAATAAPTASSVTADPPSPTATDLVTPSPVISAGAEGIVTLPKSDNGLKWGLVVGGLLVLLSLGLVLWLVLRWRQQETED